MNIEELIVLKLDTIEKNVADNYKELNEQVTLCRIDIGGLKVRAGIWGALAGLVPVVVGLGIWVITLQ